MNWGKGILIVIITFISAMLGMVFYSFQQTNELVEKNYYEKELKYQQKIDASSRLNKIEKNSLIELNKSITIKLPAGTFENYESGKIECIRYDNSISDRTFLSKPNSDGIIVLENNWERGNYLIRISWINNSISYYREENINYE